MIYYSHSGLEDVKSFRNLYDDAGRLQSVELYNTLPDDPNPYFTILTEYNYNGNSQVSEQEINEGSVKNDYYYNSRNWITQSQHSSGFFDYTNEYFKNGNVKSQALSGNYNDSSANTANLNFSYTYDHSNRLLQSQMTSSYKLINTYDKDGNILTLKRYGSTTNRLDSFNYTYYTGTNKLKNVMPTKGDYSYDYNGNMIKDYINNNTEIIYEYRNLITQLNHHTATTVDTMFVTKYYYDEAGNRIRKMLYKYIGSIFDMPPEGSGEEVDVSDPEYWQLMRDEVYSRDILGREMAIYVNYEIEEYPLYGLDLIGKLKNDVPYYYYKDHLGSVRAVVNSSNQLVSAQDYDQWGYILQNRSFSSSKSKFKFTEKERDAESSYDYFGARYYDSRIANWTSIDPLMEKHFDFSPYNYVLRNSLRLIDPNGEQIAFDQTALNIYNWYQNVKIERNFWNNLSLVGKEEYSRDYVKSMGNEGRVEATGDEMIMAGFAEFIVNATLKASLATTTLFRAVTSSELMSIQTLSRYSLIEGVENKYFWTSLEDSKWFTTSMKKNIESMKYEDYTLTKINVRKSLLNRKDVYKGSDVGHTFYNIGESTLNKFKQNSVLIESMKNISKGF